MELSIPTLLLVGIGKFCARGFILIAYLGEPKFRLLLTSLFCPFG